MAGLRRLLFRAPGPDPLWHIDRWTSLFGCVLITGWAYMEDRPLLGVRLSSGRGRQDRGRVGLDSPDLQLPGRNRFAITSPHDHDVDPTALSVIIHWRGRRIEIGFDEALTRNDALLDVGDKPFQTLTDHLAQRAGGKVLDIGSRDRSGVQRRAEFPDHRYVGLDIRHGGNIDLVADAHCLPFGAGSFDAVVSFATFEHLAQPWRVVLEANAALRPGGVIYILAPHTFPLHDQPWDYWRFSDRAWPSLLNPSTGFKILTTALFQPVHVVPFFRVPELDDVETTAGFAMSTVAAVKTGPSDLSWDGPVAPAYHGQYPA